MSIPCHPLLTQNIPESSYRFPNVFGDSIVIDESERSLSTCEPQTVPIPRPSPSTTIPDSILESSGRNHGGHSSSDKSLSGNEGEMTLQSIYDLCISLCTQVSDQAKEIQKLKAQIKKLKKQAKPVGRKSAKGEYSVHKDLLFDDIPKDTLDYMETEDAQDVGRTRDVVRHERPRPTSTRSLLTLKPLPKIDPKDKGKKKIEEEDESESESDGIPEAEKKFKQLASDEEMARKRQQENGKLKRWKEKDLAEEEATNDALIKNYDE
ncbi:hypothetical protein Tco_0045409 [Tanacetum coccineum]